MGVVEDSSVTSEESENMKLFLVLVLATVAICHPAAVPDYTDEYCDYCDYYDEPAYKNKKFRAARQFEEHPPNAVPEKKLLPDGREKAPLARASKSVKKSALLPEAPPPVPVDNMMMKNKKSESQPI